jgi:CP family cyanate transporter-like MFS transporter
MSTITWLPPLYQEEGLSAERTGLLLAFFAAVQIVAAFVVPALADRSHDRRPWLALTILANVVGLAAIALAPLASPWGFTALVAFGAGGLFPLALTLPLDYAADAGAASRLTAMTLGVGYLLAALGPFGTGALRDASGGYGVPFIALATLGTFMLAAVPSMKPQQQPPRSRA